LVEKQLVRHKLQERVLVIVGAVVVFGMVEVLWLDVLQQAFALCAYGQYFEENCKDVAVVEPAEIVVVTRVDNTVDIVAAIDFEVLEFAVAVFE
jgi:hypothetical protein